jgi:pimeloyl-ACP methyl ester carboxylesterase
MQNELTSLARNLAAAAAMLTLAWDIQPASAQMLGNDPHHLTESFSYPYARYYAPYALQAAAAYIDVNTMNDTRGRAGEDVEAAVEYAAPKSEYADIKERARKYLRSWRYQFGHESYLRCFENDPDCSKTIGRDRFTFAIPGGPAFHVWARYSKKRETSCSEVSIAFRGTVFTSVSDWIANFDSATSYFLDDHYRQLRRNIDAIIKKIGTLDCYRRASTQIVSVGHSLGGGLAQMAALGTGPGRPRIAKVFAFDPSPITGASLLDRNLREQNAAGLEIDRVYQTGEILAWLRPVVQQYPQPSSRCVRTVIYGVDQSLGPATLHSIKGLARGIVEASYEDGQQKRFKLPKSTGCPSQDRYRPQTDEDDYDERSPGQAPGVAALQGAPTRLAHTQLSHATDSYARNDGFEFTPGITAMEGAVVKAVRERPVAGAPTTRVHHRKYVAKRRVPAVHLGSKLAPPRG